ncbi:MAG TPA: SDR family NAD(P)-dependent oxidoreductase [Prolixibacteraceae bacterium]|nr:SDR family NAD(P)-dependent oxidoreductase [Prolixibacteraceae bacterium]
MKKTAIITGATAGIGEATAHLLAENNFNLILTGRRKERLTSLKEKIEAESGCKVLLLPFDIRSQEETENAVKSIPKEWQNIDVLINNAGLAVGMNTIDEGVVDDWERMIDTNVKGLLYITRLISPLMVQQGSGHIVNISSIAGKETYPMGNVYCATKYAVQALTKGMRLDLLKHGIKVSAVCPGAVDTEFSLVRFKGDDQKSKEVYNGFTPLYAQDIAETILFVVTRPKHVNIDDVLVMPTDQAYARDFNRKSNS